MLEAVPPDEVDRHGGRTLEVRYRRDRSEGSLPVVSMTAHDVDGTPAHVRRWEFVLIVAAEKGEEVGVGGAVREGTMLAERRSASGKGSGSPSRTSR